MRGVSPVSRYLTRGLRRMRLSPTACRRFGAKNQASHLERLAGKQGLGECVHEIGMKNISDGKALKSGPTM